MPKIAAGVILAWGRTIYKQFELLAGKSAPHDFVQLLIYKATTFSDEIEQVDTVRAYHVRSICYYLPVVLDSSNVVIERTGTWCWRWSCPVAHVISNRVTMSKLTL